MPFLLIIIVVGFWFFFGDPKNDVAGWFWEYEQAPWEDVDAFYYPDRRNLFVDVRMHNVGTVEWCRAWAYQQAAAHGDPRIQRGDYECGVGYLRDFGSVKVYRITVR